MISSISPYINKPFILKANSDQNPKSVYPAFTSRFVPHKMPIAEILKDLGLDCETVSKLISYKKISHDDEVLDTVNGYLNENSYNYFNHIVSDNRFCKKEFIKFIFASANPKFKDFKNWNELEEIYNNLYLPIINSKKNSAMPKKYLEYNAKEIVCLKLKNPDEFQKFEDLGIIDLIKNGKISLNILSKHYDGVKFIPEIYDDLEKLRNGESIIKSFESLADVGKKTDAGDVIEVNGKMYLNNNGKIEPWQMSREKFEELFPLVDRFVTVQGDDDCYLITVLNSLYRNPTTRGSYYKMFEQNGNDIYVTIPAYKEYGGKIKFKDGKIMTVKGSAIASKNLQMLERAYSRLSLRYPQIEGEANINPLTTKNLTFLQERIRFGLEDETFNEFVQLEGCDSIDIERNKPKGIKILEKYAANPKYILTETVDTTGQGDLHSIVIEKYDKQAGIVYYTDPYKSWQIQRQPLSQFYNEAVDITVARLK